MVALGHAAEAPRLEIEGEGQEEPLRPTRRESYLAVVLPAIVGRGGRDAAPAREVTETRDASKAGVELVVEAVALAVAHP